MMNSDAPLLLLLPLLVLSLHANAVSAEEPAEAAPTTAEPVPASPATAAADEEERQVFEARGRIHAGWEYQHWTGNEATTLEERNANYFLVRRSRLKAIWRPEDWLKAQLQIDPAAGWNSDLLRDAYVQLTPLRQLRFRVGQFKKPFSGLELRSPARLKVIERGPGNDLIVDDLNFGDRDLGAMVYGRLIESVRLDYAVGAFNGQIPDQGVEQDKDLVARLRIRPVKVISVGTSWSFKFFSPDEPEDPEHAWAGGGDVRLRLFGMRLHTEVLAAENYEATGSSSPYALSVVSILSYRRRIPMDYRFSLEPVFKFELLDADTNITDDEVLVYTPGINLYFGRYFRAMVHADFTRGNRNTQVSYDSEYEDGERLMVNLCLDI